MSVAPAQTAAVSASHAGATPVRPARVGLWTFLASETIAFGALGVAAAALRLKAGVTFRLPGDPPLPVAAEGFGAVLLLAAVAALALAQDGAVRGLARSAWGGWGIGVMGGLGALALRTGSTLAFARGNPAHTLPPHVGLYAGCFYALSALHAVHTLGGLWATLRLSPCRLGEATAGALTALGDFWMFLAAMQLLLFVLCALEAGS